jgi:uncharacterized protein with NRDE domain
MHTGHIHYELNMCLIVLSYKQHPGFRLILAANRDEFYERPTQALAFWEDRPDTLAGLDLKSGGTWLGITKTGRMAAITNFRHIPSIKQDAPSRGKLVKDFLTGSAAPAEYLAHVKSVGDRYNGFNLIVGDADTLGYYSNRGDDVLELKPGLYGLSNHLLDTPWPKVQKVKERFQDLVAGRPEVSSHDVFEMLHDTSRPPDDTLPDTGIGLEWERILSPLFITSDTYGTRSSSLIAWKENGELTFSEKTYDEGADLSGDDAAAVNTFHLQVDPPSSP